MNIDTLERQIIGDVWTSSSLWNNLTYLCDVCNGRLSGSEDEIRAGEFLLRKFKEAGLVNVHAEPFDMPVWTRGETHIGFPAISTAHDLTAMALVGSPTGEVEAEIVNVNNGTEDDFQKVAGELAGKIILTNPEGPHRLEKYLRAQAFGAKALLLAQGQPGSVMSAGSLGLRSEEPQIPVVNITKETAEFIRRQLANGAVKAKLVVGGERRPGQARNIVAELPGNIPQEGWIIACGHYDGHDLAQAAQDNGTGTAVVLEAARALAPYRSQLKAGIRFVLFSGEEEGIYGSPAYVRAHRDEWDSFRAVYNADIVGCGSPLFLKTQNSPDLAAFLHKLPLTDFGARLEENEFINNSDHFSFSAIGVSSLWAVSAIAQNEGWVHSPSDTLDKIDINYLRAAAITTTRVLLHLAGKSDQLSHGRKSAEDVKQAILSKGWEKLLQMQGRFPV